MTPWTYRRSIVCRDAVAVMSDYIDGRLPRAEAKRLARHLAACPHCHNHLEQLRITVDALGHAEPDDLSPAALADLVEVYRRWQAG
jgi:anti-sigma factor RsiW